MTDQKREDRRKLEDLNLDPVSAQQADPESWDERGTSMQQDADRYEAERPPHHGD